MPDVFKESEIATKFIEYFSENYEIYKEVPCYGIIDFVAVSGKIRTAVEVKTAFSFKVIEQAHRNKESCHYSYIAVPIDNVFNHTFQLEICRLLGIGVLAISKRTQKVNEISKPKLNRTLSNKMKLEEYMKESVAGSQSNRITAFGNTVREIVKYLKENDGEEIDKVLSSVKYHWHSLSSAKSCIYQWCRSGVIKDFELTKGRLYLKKNGK